MRSMALALVLSTGAVLTPTHVTTVHLPGHRLRCQDISYVYHGVYYMSDASNRRVDRIAVRTGQALSPLGNGLFSGPAGCRQFDFSREGPQGLFAQNHTLWVGDGSSVLRAFDLRTGQLLASVSTGGQFRADEIAGNHQAVLVTNPDDSSPFLTLVSQSTKQILRKIVLPGVTSYEQPQWNPITQQWFVNVFSQTGSPDGAVAVLARNGDLVRMIPTPGCNPGGLALNLRDRTMALGCDFGQASLIMSWDGTVLHALPDAAGTDEVWPVRGFFLFGSFQSGACVVVSRDGITVASVPSAHGGIGFHACAGAWLGHTLRAFVPGLPGVAIWDLN